MSSVLFLSDAWVQAVDEALATLKPTIVEPPITIEYQVSGGPEGDRTHRIILGPGGIRARRHPGYRHPGYRHPGSSGTGDSHDTTADENTADEADPTVTLRLDWELALAINRGTVSAQGAFLDGRIQLAGDPSALLAQQDQLGEIDDVVASVRVRTTSE